MQHYPHEPATLAPREEIEAFLAKLISEAAQLNQYQVKLFAITAIIENTTLRKTRLTMAAKTLSGQLQSTIRRSGIFESDYFTALKPEINENETPLEAALEDAYMMLQELRWQFVKLMRICSSIIEDEQLLRTETRTMLQEAVRGLES